MSAADWIGVCIFVSTIVTAVAAAYFQARKGPEVDSAAVDRGEARALVLTPEDRALLTSLRDAMRNVTLEDDDRRLVADLRDIVASLRDVSLQLGRRLDNCTDELAELGRSVKNNTAAIERHS